MNNINKIALIGGSIVGAGALAYFLLRSTSGSKGSSSSSSSRVLSRELVLNVLKSLKKELFAVVMQISMMAQQMKQYSQGKLDYDIKDFIFSYPAINQEIQSSIDKAYRKNGVTEQELQHSCETTFKDDKEIQTLMAGIRIMIDNAAEGKEIDMKTELPEFLTSETLLQIVEKIMRETTKHMQTIFKKIKDQHGELNLNDPRIAQQLQTLQADDIKANIFAEYNLEDFDDPAQKIVSFATQKFAQESPEFQHKMMQLELKQRKSMEGIMQNPGSEDLVDKIFSEEIPSMGGHPGAGGQFPGFHAQRRRQAPAPAQASVTKPVEPVLSNKASDAPSAVEPAPVVIENNSAVLSNSSSLSQKAPAAAEVAPVHNNDQPESQVHASTEVINHEENHAIVAPVEQNQHANNSELLGSVEHVHSAASTIAHVEHAHVAPVHVEQPQVEPAHVELAHVEHAQVAPAHVEPAHVEPTHVEPAHVEPAHVAPSHVEPAHVEPAHAHAENAENAVHQQ